MLFVPLCLLASKKDFVLKKGQVELDDSYVAREGTPHAPYIPVSLGRARRQLQRGVSPQSE